MWFLKIPIRVLALSSKDSLILNFSVTTPGSSITAFRFYGSSRQTGFQAEFSIDGGTAQSKTAAEISVGLYQFEVSGVAGFNSISAASPHQLNILSITSSGAGYNIASSSTITNNPLYGFYDTSYNTGPSARFEVVGVPEPGTMLLGGIAAAVGGAGAWWKRRKGRQAAAALVAGDGA